ncbi:MAG: asparaginase [bacterium]
MKTDLKSSDKPIAVEATRTDRREAIHLVNATLCDSAGQMLAYFGDPFWETYLRSAAKPFQLLNSITFRPSLFDECTDEELAVMAASHSGEPKHLETVQRIQERYGLTEDLLKCGQHPPYYLPAFWEYGRIGKKLSPIHCNCSGKHTAMLLACQAQSWPMETYLEGDHPVQIANTKLLGRLSGVEPKMIYYGVDGCNVPTWWLTIKDFAVAFARFGDPEFIGDEMENKIIDRIFDAYHNTAWFMGGTGRFCTSFNEESDGEWLGKIGGEGIYGISFRKKGLGIAVKVRDGNTRALPPAILYVMNEWGLIDDVKLKRLSNWVNVVSRNSSDIPIGFLQVAQS